MIHAAIFDMDGVIVETERIKALSYARAALELCPGKVTEGEIEQAYHEIVSNIDFCPLPISEDAIIEAYKELVGRSRQEMAEGLMKRFALESILRTRMSEYGVDEPWQALVKVRMPVYEALIQDPETLLASQWPHNVSILHFLKKEGYRVALATMSDRKHVLYILDVIGLTGIFDCIMTADEISRGKPDPEIYQLISQRLDLPPADCLVFEDSPSGVRAGIAAGMHVIAVTSPFTQKAVHAAQIIDPQWIIDDPDRLREVVDQMLREQK